MDATKMTDEDILRMVDHTQLAPDATWDDIRRLCDDALACDTASVCIPPSFVGRTAGYLGGEMRITTVIGFPNGYSTSKAKAYETRDAIDNGADEIDMVANIGWERSDLKRAQDDILMVRDACAGHVLKVIIETCLLTDNQKRDMCRIVSESGADFIKTSTGFSKGGATVHDVALLSDNVSNMIGVKAAGGIHSFDDARALISAGATRLGTSRLVNAWLEEHPAGREQAR